MLTLDQAFRRGFSELQGDGRYTGFGFLSSTEQGPQTHTQVSCNPSLFSVLLTWELENTQQDWERTAIRALLQNASTSTHGIIKQHIPVITDEPSAM